MPHTRQSARFSATRWLLAGLIGILPLTGGCDSKPVEPNSIERQPGSLRDINPLFAQAFEGGVSLSRLQVLLTRLHTSTPVEKNELDSLIDRMQGDVAAINTGLSLEQTVTEINRYVFDIAKITAAADPHAVEAGLLTNLIRNREATPFALAHLYTLLARTAEPSAALVELPDGHAVRLQRDDAVAYVLPAQRGRLCSLEQLRQLYRDHPTHNLPAGDLENARLLAPLTDMGIASRFLSNCGYGLMQRNEPLPAADCLNAAVLVDPDSRPARLRRGEFYLAAGNLNLAQADFDTAINMGPDFVASYLGAARVAAMLDYETAAARYQRALALKPNCLDAMAGLAAVYARQGMTAKAMDLLQAGLVVDANHPGLLSGMGRLYFDAGRYPEATDYYTRALAVDPYQAEWYVYLGTAYQELGKLPEALATYDAGLRYQSSNFPLRYQRAAALLRLKRHAEAIAEYKSMLAMTSDPGKLHERIADAAMDIPDYATALTYYQSALQHQDNAISLHYKTARAYSLQGNLEAAHAALRGAIDAGFRDTDTVSRDAAFQPLLAKYPLRDLFAKE